MSHISKTTYLALGALAACLTWAPAAWAQDAPAGGESLEAKVNRLEREVNELKAKRDSKDDRIKLSGWQLQLHGQWFTNAQDHDEGIEDIFKSDNSNDGWGIGVGLMAPLWPDLGPISLYGYLGIDYRQLGSSPDYTAPITGQRGTVSYLNIVAAPTIQFTATEMLRPFVRLGANMQVASPPTDAISYLDVGFLLGGGVDVRPHERLSLGVTYDYTWFGVADQEDEDYGVLTVYVGFNF